MRQSMMMGCHKDDAPLDLIFGFSEYLGGCQWCWCDARECFVLMGPFVFGGEKELEEFVSF